MGAFTAAPGPWTAGEASWTRSESLLHLLKSYGQYLREGVQKERSAVHHKADKEPCIDSYSSGQSDAPTFLGCWGKYAGKDIEINLGFSPERWWVPTERVSYASVQAPGANEEPQRPRAWLQQGSHFRQGSPFVLVFISYRILNYDRLADRLVLQQQIERCWSALWG